MGSTSPTNNAWKPFALPGNSTADVAQVHGTISGICPMGHVIWVDVDRVEAIMSGTKTIEWIQAQQEVLKQGGLSQTQVHYMSRVFGGWTV